MQLGSVHLENIQSLWSASKQLRLDMSSGLSVRRAPELAAPFHKRSTFDLSIYGLATRLPRAVICGHSGMLRSCTPNLFHIQGSTVVHEI